MAAFFIDGLPRGFYRLSRERFPITLRVTLVREIHPNEALLEVRGGLVTPISPAGKPIPQKGILSSLEDGYYAVWGDDSNHTVGIKPFYVYRPLPVGVRRFTSYEKFRRLADRFKAVARKRARKWSPRLREKGQRYAWGAFVDDPREDEYLGAKEDVAELHHLSPVPCDVEIGDRRLACLARLKDGTFTLCSHRAGECPHGIR